ncbi:hypothetical protein LOTGIDRAFT_153564 [Lottia gigantea]|uniref:AIG1-type G domain-containing protein n=1 Tax=Lottia gigantea TaxID=225164 RepID=V4A7V9_LOTGI|nr:hypothetical protein LOTGIDRAFT_153564 [Lottia gigantea]ESO91130.1 hypothetical protein LOTGIDRAFT_153564 [Lottia gigantea]
METEYRVATLEYRVVLFGKTGIGKSSVGNSLLGKTIFQFTSYASSATEWCKMGEAQTSIGKLLVVDTPGLFDTDKPKGETIEELIKSIAVVAPGPHVFIFVLTVARFTEEDIKSVDIMKKILGEGTMHHIIVVFTRKDQLVDDGVTEEEFMAKTPGFLKQLLKDVNNRYEFICNRQKNSSHQQDVENVLSLIKKTVEQNSGNFYTQDMFEATEKVIQQEIRESQKTRQEIKTAIVNNEPGILSKIIDGVIEIIKVSLPHLITTIGEYFLTRQKRIM